MWRPPLHSISLSGCSVLFCQINSLLNHFLSVHQLKLHVTLPGPCFGRGAVSGPNSNSTWELFGAGADMAEYPDSLDWLLR